MVKEELACKKTKIVYVLIAFNSVLIQVISMIKGLSGALSRLESVFASAIRHFIHAELQEFIQITMREPLRKAAKNSKKTLMKTLVY